MTLRASAVTQSPGGAPAGSEAGVIRADRNGGEPASPITARAALPSAGERATGGTTDQEPHAHAMALWGLTEQQARIAQLAANGYTGRETAAFLWITESTVKFHMAGIFERCGVRNRVELVRAWILEVEIPCAATPASGASA